MMRRRDIPRPAWTNDDDDADEVEGEDPNRFRFTLSEAESSSANESSEGDDEANGGSGSTVSDATPEELNGLFKRISKPLQEEESDRMDFAMREKSLPAPKTGERILKTFSPSSEETHIAIESRKSSNLEVVRYLPEGDVPEGVPHMSITFSQPMIAIGTLEDVEQQKIPVHLNPLPEGKWKWLGSRTLNFVPKYRFPMSTKFDVTIPAGTKSINGEILNEEKKFSFKTPTVQVKQVWPEGTSKRDTLIFVSFSQRIIPSNVIPHIKVKSEDKELKIVEATKGELEDKKIQKLISKAQQDDKEGIRWIAVRSQELLPYNATVTISVEPKIPSAEGTLLSTEQHTFEFTTFGPFKFVEADNYEPAPKSELRVRLSNTIDDDSIKPEDFKIERNVEGVVTELTAGEDGTLPERFEIRALGDVLYFKGNTQRATYKFYLPQSLKDTYDQNLEPNQEFSVVVGPAKPYFQGHRTGYFIQDTSVDPIYPICTCNVKQVRLIVRRVTSDDFVNSHWSGASRIQHSETTDLAYWLGEKGETVVDKAIDIEAHDDQYVITKIDLKQYLQYPEEGLGNIVVGIQPVAWKEAYIPRVTAWIQCTKLGLEVYSDTQRFIVWTNSLVDGSPVKAHFWTGGLTGDTGDDGTATVDTSDKGKNSTFFASKGNDWTLLQNVFVLKDNQKPYTIIHAFNDRNIYKVKEEVHIKGYARDVRFDDAKKVNLAIAQVDVEWAAFDPRGAELGKGKVTPSRFGSFDFNFKIPDNANLGRGHVRLTSSGTSSVCSFDIQEFRKPESKISCTASNGPFFRNSSAVVTTRASYYSGGKLTDARVNWNVTSNQSTYRPPGWSEFSFGESVHVWNHYRSGSPSQTKNLEGKTDITGSHYLSVSWEGAYEPPKPVTITANATIVDINNQTLASSTSFIVHPSRLYAGLKKELHFVQPNQPFPLQFIVTGVDGKAVEQVPIHVALKRLDPVWDKKSHSFINKETQISVTTLTSQSTPIDYAPSFEEGGNYNIVVIVEDEKGCQNSSSCSLYVMGGLHSSGNENLEIKVVTDKETYVPGDVAIITIVSPFHVPSEGLYHILSGTIEESHRFRISESFTIKVPIKENHIPQVQVFFDILGTEYSKDKNGKDITDGSVAPKPKRAHAARTIGVPSASFFGLDVTVTPEQTQLRPGGTTNIQVSVKSKSGEKAADAEIALIVVDDAILSLTGYNLPNALDAFTPTGYSQVASRHNRDQICVIDFASLQPVFPSQTTPQPVYSLGVAGNKKFRMMARGGMECGNMVMLSCAATTTTSLTGYSEGASGGSGGNEVGNQIEVRSDFDPLALFAVSVVTNAEGEATIPIKLPDSLTSYRVWAVVSWKIRHFGQAESSLVAQLPLSIRPSIPRFLNFGDKTSLNVVVSNQTAETQQAIVGLRTTNFNLQTPGFNVSIAPNKRVVLGFVGATENVGVARFQFALASRDFADAAEEKIPVWTPATTEAFATYGEIADQAGAEKVVLQPIVAPSEQKVFVQFGGIEVTTSSTALSSLTDAYIYLQSYPFECTEQIASRALATIALKDVLKAFKVPGLPSDTEIQEQLESDLKKLGENQRRDGGFGWWNGSHYSSPYLAIHAAHLVQRAQSYGYTLPSNFDIPTLKNYLKTIDQYFDDHLPVYYRNSLKAYALYVLHRFRELSKEEAVILYQQSKDEISLESLAWLLVAINDTSAPESQEILKKIENSVVETAETINFVTKPTDTGKYVFLESERRTDGIILEALLDIKEKTTLATKVVKGLLAHKKRGRWGNTQENCFIILALRKYFDVFESNEPDFSAGVWLDSKFAGEQEYRGRTADSHVTNIPMKHVTSSEPSTVRTVAISKEGEKGVLYYRIGMSYAPTDLSLKERDEGFEVTRVYEAVDDPAHVKFDREANSWHLKSGERIRVRLTLTNTARRYHVALVDKLPAGLEAVNPSLKTSERIPSDPQEADRGCWWHSSWFEHQNFRDERVEAFASILYPGTHKYTYIARVTSKGTFVLPPASAEEMYAPEIFGRSSSERVIVN